MRRVDYYYRRNTISLSFGLEAHEFGKLLKRLYHEENMSAQEIVDLIKTKANVTISPKSIQRQVKLMGLIRTGADAFRLAAKRGRVQWAYKSEKMKKRGLATSLRYSILKRDGFRCVLCGLDASNSLLEVDHVLAKVSGGTDESSNLRTLCHECNLGKRVIEKER